MVYIVSHSWVNRWISAGIKNGIDVYSNCDAVELFNDVDDVSLGKLNNPGLGQHFQWNNVDIKYNVLYAIGYVNGKAVAKDYIVLNNLPKAPHFDGLVSKSNDILKPASNLNYLYRVNSGGDDYKDAYGNTWLADVHKTDDNTWGSLSWTDNFDNLPAFYASQRSTNDPIAGTKDWGLFQNFRYGTDTLSYEFPVPDGDYQVELYFTEPWYGTGGGMDCKNWRLFDVAINGKVVLKDLDIWSEVGHDTALKKVVHAKSENGKLKISFPNLASGQAIISAIAIATKDITVKPAKPSPKNILDVSATVAFELGSWLDTNSKQYLNANVQFNKLPSELFGADYSRFSNTSKSDVSGSFISKENATVYVILDSKINETWPWLIGFEKLPDTIQNSKGNQFQLLKKQVKKGEKVTFGPQGHQENKNMFSIVVVPVYVMGEERDERTVLKLEAEIAKTTGTGIKKAFFKSSDYIEFTENTKNSITFTVNPGVANIYLMRYRFMNLHTAPIKVRLTIEDANGTLLKNDEIEFPMAHEKWRILNTTTGGYINAGTYKIALESHQMKGLRLESFEFQ